MTTLADTFLLRERIHRGGMGVVWRARQDAFARRIAVHLIEPDPAAIPELLAQVRHEAHRVAEPNASVVIEQIARPPVVAMEQVGGVSLAHILRSSGPLARARAVDLVSQLLEALATLHDTGMVHADLQPGCVLVETGPDGEVVSLVDFGGAEDAGGSDATEYLAPELIAGGTPTVASDLYAVGVILYELLTGRHPFGGKSAVEVMTRQLRGTFPPLSLGQPDLDAVCLRAMVRTPGARFRDAREFAAALRPEVAATTPATPAAIEAQIARLRAKLLEAIGRRSGEAIVDRSLDLALALDRHARHGEAIAALEVALELVMWDDGMISADAAALERRLRLALARVHERAGEHAEATRIARTIH